MEKSGFAKRLSEARERLGLTQQQVASIVGTQQGVYHKWEGVRGKATEPSIEMLVKLSVALDVSLEWLLTGTAPRVHAETNDRASTLAAQYRIAESIDSRVAEDISEYVQHKVILAWQKTTGGPARKEPGVARHKRRAG